MMNEYQFEERLKHLETLVSRLVAKVLGEEMPRLPREEPLEPMPRFDPTAALGMPASTMREMANLDCGDARGDARALSAGREMVKQGSKSDPSQRSVGRGGWVEPRPLASHGQSAADRMIDEAIGGEGGKR
jgi:hypothetical protein